MLRVAGILPESVCDGLGIRVVVFMQGCPRHCEGCHNEKLIPLEGGEEYTPEGLAVAIAKIVTPLHKGITLSGGDPFIQDEELAAMVQILREQLPQINIWAYTGYVYDEVQQSPLLQQIDVLVDGPFVLAQRDISIAFRGSPNQRIIDMVATRANGGSLVVMELDNKQM